MDATFNKSQNLDYSLVSFSQMFEIEEYDMEAINAAGRHFWTIVLSAHLNPWPKFSIVLLIAASFKKCWCSAVTLKTEYRTSFKQTNVKGPVGDYTIKRAWKVETRKVTTFSRVNIIINIAQKREM